MKKPNFRVYSRVHFAFISAIAAMLVTQAAYADTYYWDATDPIQNAGFGTAAGTWGTDLFWSNSNAGTSTTGILSPTTTSDDLNFGYLSTGLATGTVALTGTQSAKSLTFAFGSGAIALSGGTAIDLAAVATITVNNAADTISTPLTGAGTSLTKLGTGTLTLNGANTYTGTTIIGNGTLQIGDGTTGSLNGTTGTALTFSGTGTFNVQEAAGSTQGMGVLSFNAGQGNVYSTGIAAQNSTLTFSSMAARAVGAAANFNILTNTTASENKIVLTSTSNAPLNSSGSNNPGIFFNLNNGTTGNYARRDVTGYIRAVQYGTDSNTLTTVVGSDSTKDISLIASTAVGGVTANTIKTTAALTQAVNTTTTVNGILLVGTTNVNVGTSGVATFLQPNAGIGELVLASQPTGTAQLIIRPIVQNNGLTATNVTIAGPGIVNLGSLNTYTGVTYVNSGVLRVLNWADAGANSGVGKGSNGTTPMAADIVINGGTLNFGNQNNGPARTNRLFTVGPAGATLDCSGNSPNQNWTIGQNSDLTSSGSIGFMSSINGGQYAATLTLASNVQGASSNPGNGFLWASVVDSGTGANVTSLTKAASTTGNNKWTLAASNSYSGPTTVNGGTLELTGSLTGATAITVNSGGTFTVTSTGVIGPAVASLTVRAGGTAILSSASTYNGVTRITGGTLQLGHDLALQNSIFDFSFGALTFSSGINTPTLGGLSGAGALNMAANVTALTLNPGTGVSSSYSGALSSVTAGMRLNKTGAGTQVLSGANTYTGATNIIGGSLAITGSGSIADSPRINISTSTTLDVTGVTGSFTLGAAQTVAGNGTILATGKTVTASGTLAPGASPGTLTQNGGTLALGLGGNYNWQIIDAAGAAGTGYDTMSLTGSAVLDLSLLTSPSSYNINIWSISGIDPDVEGDAANFNDTLNYSWTLFSTESEISGFDATDFSINTQPSNGATGFTNSFGDGTFSVGLADGGTDLVLNYTAVIPEPRAALLGSFGLIALLRRRR